MNFEQAYAELEGVVKKIESQSLTLEESVELFNRGIELSRKCLEYLNQTKGKISLLTDELKNITEDFKIAD